MVQAETIHVLRFPPAPGVEGGWKRRIPVFVEEK